MRRNKRPARRSHSAIDSALNSTNNRAGQSRAVQTRSRRNLRAYNTENQLAQGSSRHISQAPQRNVPPVTAKERRPRTSRLRKHRNVEINNRPFLDSPSYIWRRLPLAHRLLSLLVGFLSLYYLVFAKHHHYDKEIVSIHTDVERLMEQMKESGMNQNLVEAELPTIFKDDSTQLPSNSSTSKLKTTKPSNRKLQQKKKKKANKSKKGSKSVRKATKGKAAKKLEQGVVDAASAASNDAQSVGSAKSPNKEPRVLTSVSKMAPGAANNSGETSRITTATSAASAVTTNDTTKPASPPASGTIGDVNSATLNASNESHMAATQRSPTDGLKLQPNTSSAAGALYADGRPSTGVDPTTPAVPPAAGAGPPSGTSPHNSLSPRTLPAPESPAGAGAPVVAIPHATGKTPVDGPLADSSSHAPTSGAVNATVAVNVTSLSAEAQARSTSLPPDRAANGGSERVNASSPEMAFIKAEEKYDYSVEFKDIEPNDPSLPKDHVPLLDWNYDSVIDPETKEQIFGIGTKLDHVAAYKPLCINTVNGEAVAFPGKRVCSGFNRTAGWMWQYCDVMKESLLKEYLLTWGKEEISNGWFEEKASSIHWVNGLTILQILEKNCGNIAHFSGRALMLQHIVDNIAAYAGPPSAIENILILPTYHIMKRFLYPHNYGFWHKSLLTSLVAPAQFTIGTLGNFLYREQKIPYKGTQRVQLLHNFSVAGSVADGKEYICFRRAIVPGFLKGRFFVDDQEYPSKKPSLQSAVPDAPHVPRDSLRLRERVSAVFHHTPSFARMGKEIVFLDRTGSRRVFDNSTKEQVIAMIKKVASEKGYSFKLVSFNSMTFRQQYESMNGVALAIGIHGANLVNTMFMPPLAVLIELFPFGFMHEMYVNGGNAGLKYFRYQMTSGVPFTGPKRYRSVEQCVKLNQECKVHFRDSILQVTPADMTALEGLLRKGIDWCDARSTQQANK